MSKLTSGPIGCILAALLSILSAQSLAAAAETAAAGCPDVPGLAPLLAPGTAILAGEMHGTREAPSFVRAVACSGLAAGVPVTVALEIDRAENAAFQEFLRSDGSEAARARLLASPFWHRKFQDGRSSEAMLGLVDDLRRLSAGAAPGAFHLLLLDRPQPGDQRDQAMAERLAEAIDARPGDLFVALTGNIHNRLQKGMSWNEELEPMAYRLHRMRPDARLVSLDMAYPGGSAWVCFGQTPEDCKAQELHGPESAEGRSGVELSKDPEGAPYSGRYFTGPISASPPAVGEAGPDG